MTTRHQVFFVHIRSVFVFPFGAVIQSSCQGSNLNRPFLLERQELAQDEEEETGYVSSSQRFAAKIRRVRCASGMDITRHTPEQTAKRYRIRALARDTQPKESKEEKKWHVPLAGREPAGHKMTRGRNNSEF